MLPEQFGERSRFQDFVYPSGEAFGARPEIVEVDVTRTPRTAKEEPHVCAALEHEIRDWKPDRSDFDKGKVKPLDDLPRFAF